MVVLSNPLSQSIHRHLINFRLPHITLRCWDNSTYAISYLVALITFHLLSSSLIELPPIHNPKYLLMFCIWTNPFKPFLGSFFLIHGVPSTLTHCVFLLLLFFSLSSQDPKNLCLIYPVCLFQIHQHFIGQTERQVYKSFGVPEYLLIRTNKETSWRKAINQTNPQQFPFTA